MSSARAHLLALIAPLAIGDALVPGLILVDAATELGLGWVFAAGDDRLRVEVHAAGTGVRHVARAGALVLGYRGRDHALGAAACAELARRITDRSAAFLSALAADRAALADAPRVREVAVDRLLELAGPPAARFYTASPYVGCLIGCRFCYAQERLHDVRAIVGLPLAPWGSWVDVRGNAPEVLAAELATLPPLPIKFCPIVSDPYHAVEARLGLTRRCLEVLVSHPAPPPVMLLTRAALVARDLDLWTRLPRAWVGMSLPTVDEAVAAHFEPRAASVAERLATLGALRAAGVRTFAVVQPMLPGPIDGLADALAAVVDSVSLDVLRGEGDAGPLFAEPDYLDARSPAWQAAHSAALAAALADRGVATWTGELPPEIG